MTKTPPSPYRRVPISIQHGPDHAALRARYGGSSEAPALFGLGYEGLASQYAVWALKSGIIELPSVEDDDRVFFGRELETVIGMAVARKHGWELRRADYYAINERHRMGATVDFDVVSHPDGPGIIETKSRDTLAWRRAYTETEASDRDKIQLAHQFACLPEMKWGCIAALVGGNDLRTYPYTRADLAPIIADVTAAWDDLWRRVKDRDEPPLTSEDVRAWLRQHPESNDEVLVINAPATPLNEAITNYGLFRAQAREATKRADECRAMILQAAGDHGQIVTSDYRVTIRRSTGKPTTITLPKALRYGLAHGAADAIAAAVAWVHVTREASVRTTIDITANDAPPRDAEVPRGECDPRNLEAG
ncbi:MAG: hypothetical protein FJX78_05975 [Armatimonadetes bacterium]|nr:hypothetical protein [Armatimonadota bacterium]